MKRRGRHTGVLRARGGQRAGLHPTRGTWPQDRSQEDGLEAGNLVAGGTGSP